MSTFHEDLGAPEVSQIKHTGVGTALIVFFLAVSVLAFYALAGSFAATFCLPPLKPFLVIEAYCPEVWRYSYQLSQERGALSWVVQLRTSLPLMLSTLEREYDTRLFWLYGFSSSLDDRLKSHVRSAYEDVKDKIELTIHIIPSSNSLLKEEPVEPQPPYWVVPNDFKDEVTLWLSDVKSFTPTKAEVMPWASWGIGKSGWFEQNFTFSVPLGQFNLEKALRTAKLTARIGITNTGGPMVFDFPLPLQFAKIVAANPYREDFLSRVVNLFYPRAERLDAEELIPRIIREAFPDLDFSIFPVVKKTDYRIPSTSN